MTRNSFNMEHLSAMAGAIKQHIHNWQLQAFIQDYDLASHSCLIKELNE